ncbi:tyrosine-type recombinase/integrase [Serratia quinivorans]|uniref:tyrosine-type recombinase/integrase n=1 Tax=Serratia quinivorans TaxID=137545 RepID=UPI002179DDB4|nr:tyrosine-type recombinase/integrase [Serratia quinivorans]CAI1114694.1 site-specific tyrosine recombinase XerC [Serratia quinivorans]CAI2074151.1 site-specific tyrosine recombinase XerC [Serratia quinivorans]
MRVEALRSKEEIQEFKTLLVEMNNGNTLYRDLFIFLSHTGYRISDALLVEFPHIKGDELEVREQKTGKVRRVKLHPAVLTMIAERRERSPHHVFLFEVETNRAKGKAVSRQSVSKAFRETGERLGRKVGTHTGRKTLGYAVYKNTKDIGLTMKMLNHSSAATTQAYIGITDNDVSKAMMEVDF